MTVVSPPDGLALADGVGPADDAGVADGPAVTSGLPCSTDGAGVGALDGTPPSPPLGEQAATVPTRARNTRMAKDRRGWRLTDRAPGRRMDRHRCRAESPGDHHSVTVRSQAVAARRSAHR